MRKTEMGKDNSVFTVIFDFDCNPSTQQELEEKLPKLVDSIVSKQPGFISAHLHLSTDGKKVLNYFQWKSKEAFETFRNNKAAQEKIRPVLSQYNPTPRVYNIVFTAVA